MSAQPYLSLIVPAFNEAGRIRSTLDEFQAHLNRQPFSYEILVSADGTDGTREIVAERARKDGRLHVLGSPERGGKGKGIRLAVEKARGQVIGFADADNKTPIDDLDRLLPWLKDHEIVIGSRGQKDSQVMKKQKWYRQYGSKGFWLVMQLVVGLPGIRDTQCGFKFFRGDVARDLFARQRIDGYMFDVEVLYLAHQSRYRIKEVGVRWRDDGDSRLGLIKGNLRNALDILRIRFDRSRPCPKKPAAPPARMAA
jgi:dolichyl-phosphate beta-glucosyltransferase